ncbi:MAG: response regulator transcription factor [Sideroxydans sp.]|nr:response regulator transcription factor [Sideroxydans sp.]
MKMALILEDLPESQVLLREVIQAAFPGIRVRCESNIADALNIINQFQFDLALVDLSLPDGDGTMVVDALAERFPHCMIVVATIFDDDAHLFPALRAGAQGYLLKDQPPALLINQLYGISEGRPPLSPAIARRLLGHFKVSPKLNDTPIDATLALSEREQAVLLHLARGLNSADIAALLEISRHTVNDHVKNIYVKLNVSSRAEAAVRAKGMGLV